MSQSPNYLDSWPIQQTSRQGSVTSSLSSPSDTLSINFANLNLPPTPALSGRSDNGRLSNSTPEHNVHVPLSKPVHISFSKGSNLFKLRYSQVQLRRDVAGHLKDIVLTDPAGMQSAFLHSFPGTKNPIPHLESPVTASAVHISRVSFLEEQNVQTANTLFQAQPQYTFETWEGKWIAYGRTLPYGQSLTWNSDCVHFQEALLGQTVLFTAGIAEAKSKGRGEECISQNLRILRSRTGKQTILFFANSQRKEKKRYISVPRKSP